MTHIILADFEHWEHDLLCRPYFFPVEMKLSNIFSWNEDYRYSFTAFLAEYNTYLRSRFSGELQEEGATGDE